MFGRAATLPPVLDAMGIGPRIAEAQQVLVKINLARPPQPGHPRTDAGLLADLIEYVTAHGGRLTLAECADGFLATNITAAGLSDVVADHAVTLLDLDHAATDCVMIDDEAHYIPTCLRDFPLRIGFPVTSQRREMTFSSNIKLFVGAVPRRFYQLGEPSTARPRIHVNLHQSVAAIYRAIQHVAPFQYFINGGNAFFEGLGDVTLPAVFVGDDGLELDQTLVQLYDLEPPDYFALL